MAFQDLRDWLDALKKRDELKEVNVEVDWNEEIGAITRKVLDKEKEAILFNKIKGYHKTACRQVHTNSLTTYHRVAMMLGLPADIPVRDIIQNVRKRTRAPFCFQHKPVFVHDGPVREVIISNKDVNLYDLPVPKWNPRDGGRYISTFCAVVTKDPETGWINAGLYRGMIVDEQTIAMLVWPDKHYGQHFFKYQKRREAMPLALVIGWDPILPFCAAAPYPPQVSEYDMMGALREEPVPLVKCETIDLEVPASAEIVIEGLMSTNPSDFFPEGPFGEFPGYYGGEKSPKPAMKVQCITHRKDPIFVGTLEGKPIVEDCVVCSINMSAYAWNGLESMGVPYVTDVFCPPATGFGTNIRVQIKKKYQGHAKQVAAGLFALQPGAFKNVIVVEDDIDIHDNLQTEWAFAYRVDAKEDGIVIFPGFPGSGLDPSTPPQWKDPEIHGRARWNRLLIDATRDWRFPKREVWGGENFPPVVEMSKDMDVLTRKRWKEYGFD